MRRFEEKQGTALLKSGMSVCLLFAVDLFNTVKLKITDALLGNAGHAPLARRNQHGQRFG